MQPVLDLSKEYGIVLEGGGARGAYQIGAWKALKEAGVKIKGVAGTSVGALNGALICMGDVERAEYLWENITFSQVMNVDDEKMIELFHKQVPSHEALVEILRIIREGGADITPLKKLIADNIDEDYIRNGSIEFYLLTFSLTDFKHLDVDVKEIEKGLLHDYLLASSYLPVFKNEKLHGKKYMDGGAINNVPLGSLVDRNYKDIIVIRIFGIGHEKKVKIPQGVTVYQIEPQINLGRILYFEGKRSKKNILAGYYDTNRFLYGLEGKIYYLLQNHDELFYVNKLLSISETMREKLAEIYKLPLTGMNLRTLLEYIYPSIAVTLKLKKDWNYTFLCVSMLEASAKFYKIYKYCIYTTEDLWKKIKDKSAGCKKDDIPVFAQIITDIRFIE